MLVAKHHGMKKRMGTFRQRGPCAQGLHLSEAMACQGQAGAAGLETGQRLLAVRVLGVPSGHAEGGQTSAAGLGC